MARLSRSIVHGERVVWHEVPSLETFDAAELLAERLVDDCDDADGRWWSELLLGFAAEIAESLPLFLFLVVEGGSRPGEHSDGESDALAVARELTARQLAEWLPIPLAQHVYILPD